MPNEFNHPVIELIKQRKEKGSLPKNRTDNYKLWLVIEWGGMRGIVWAAMATGLHNLDLVNTFDAVYGSSAWSIAGALLITNNMPMGPNIYCEDLTKKSFINLYNVFSKNKAIVDIGFLVKNILQDSKPLDWKGVIESDIPLNIILSSFTKRQSLCINTFKSKEDLFTLLQASASMPVFSGDPIEYNNDLIWDALVYEPIPYKTAISQWCTHILTLLTKPKSVIKENPKAGFIDKYIIAPKLKKISLGVRDDFLELEKQYNESLWMLYTENSSKNASPAIYSVYLPEQAQTIWNTENNKKKLTKIVDDSIYEIMKLFR